MPTFGLRTSTLIKLTVLTTLAAILINQTPIPKLFRLPNASSSLRSITTASGNRFFRTGVNHDIMSNPAADVVVPTTRQGWKKALDELPTLEDLKGRMPTIYLAHGSPALIIPPSSDSFPPSISKHMGPKSDHAKFLGDLGPKILEKYGGGTRDGERGLKGVVVLSAHWETERQIEITATPENTLYYDYYGFPDELYNLDWPSNGSVTLAERVREVLGNSGVSAKLDKGSFGRKTRGLDHGVFVPFMLMWPPKKKSSSSSPTEPALPVPIIEVSMYGSLNPDDEFNLGKALAPLRDEGILIISGGLAVHNLGRFDYFSPELAPPELRDFNQKVVDSIQGNSDNATERENSMKSLVKHSAFKKAHPRAEHFVPIYVAAGAGGGEGDRAKVICGLYGAVTAVFGV